jgi:hypothetical protein
VVERMIDRAYERAQEIAPSHSRDHGLWR